MKVTTSGSRWSDTRIGRVVISQIAHSMTAEEQDRFHKARAERADKDIEVRLTIDGVETDFGEWFERIDAQLDRFIADEAGKLIREQFGDLTSRLSDTINEMERGLRAKVVEMLGYDPWRHER